jgi:plastocyanin
LTTYASISKMRFSTAALSTVLPALALAANFTVDVGLNGLAFTPTSITAAVGDIVNFVFHPKNHSVTQSLFTSPCTPAFDATTGAQGFDSGFMPIANGSSAPMPIKVTVATPLWFFCRQTVPAPHCSTSGMTFAINPTADKTFAQFQANAKASASTAATGGATTVAGASSVAGASASASGAASAPSTAVGGAASGSAVTGGTVEGAAGSASDSISASGSSTGSDSASGSATTTGGAPTTTPNGASRLVRGGASLGLAVLAAAVLL